MVAKDIEWAKKPDFFIVGAPKCGTTAMNAYLREHPEIFVPESKELHFFGTDLAFKHDRSEASYKTHFESWTDEKVGGEASVWYLRSEVAAQEIHAFNPTAKILIMLRSPVEMVYAQHSQAVYVGRETLTEFRDALEAEEARRSGKLKTHPLSPPEVFNYSEIARYTDQIRRYVEVFGRENIHITIFDDLKADAGTAYGNVLKFLGVSTAHSIDLSPRNKNRRYKNKQLHFLVNNPHPAFRALAKKLMPDGLLKWTKSKLQKVNTSRAPRDKIDSESKSYLQEIYKDEVLKLSDFLDRDLKHWNS